MTMARKSRVRARDLTRTVGRLARFALKSRLLTVFLGLCVLGVFVGAQTRPDPKVVPYEELFDQMSVLSYRESPSDTSARFVVELSAGGRVFRQYDLDGRSFQPPARDRDYNRTITGTFYRPLQFRGHVTHGLWLDVPRQPGPSLLPEQFDELYRATLGFVKPVSLMAGVLGTLSGYSVGYRLGAWNSSLGSHAVQDRVLATPDLGRVIAREAWRRVLLEPVVTGQEEDATRLAAVRGTQRIYANFFRIALNDSDGFIPREAARLARLGHEDESRAMLAFAEAVQRAALDSVQVTSGDFSAVERWASLLVRRGHWAYDAIPPAGEERAQYLGMLAWYGVAPPSPDMDRVWVGPRVLVREGETEGFVADEIPATRVGCPIAWRPKLQEERTAPGAMASAWFADRPEFMALATLGRRVAGGLASVGRQIALRSPVEPSVSRSPPRGPDPAATTTAGFASRTTIVAAPAPTDSAPPRSIRYALRSLGSPASITLVTADSAAAAPRAGAAQAALERIDLLAGRGTATARGAATDAAADTLRAEGVRDALIDVAGSMVALGAPAHAGLWEIGIRDPRDPTPCFARLRLAHGQAVSTAGEYEQFVATDGRTFGRGVVAPATRPAAGLVSVTALAPNAWTADSAGAALLARGLDDAKRLARERADLSAILIERGADGVDTLWVESGLGERFTLQNECGSRLRVEYY
jgi:hypothetical protein